MGLEPTHPKAYASETYVSTNSTTRANEANYRRNKNKIKLFTELILTFPPFSILFSRFLEKDGISYSFVSNFFLIF